MERELTEVYCGNGKGKTALAIGQSIREAVQGRSVIVIQFLKGCEKRSLDFLEEMDNLDFKIFRFEKRDCCYDQLTEEEKAALEEMKQFRTKFEEAMDDDLNTADAVSAIFELVKFANTKADENSSKAFTESLKKEIAELCDILVINFFNLIYTECANFSLWLSVILSFFSHCN